jgi:6-pyruvoyl-tetrahydropterin synthase related domain
VGAKAAIPKRSKAALSPDDRTCVQPGSVIWAPLLAIATAAFAVEVPFLFRGTASGHDLEFHLYSWLEVLSQWKLGILYPRWAALAHFGYGEPRFVFYPPVSWTLGALLGAIFPWVAASSIYIWLVLVAAGVSMFVLARRWLDRRDATFAAVLYAVNPYHLVIIYWRSAFAELLASSLLPLVVLLLLRHGERRRRTTVPLAIVLAAAWLINAPAAVMIHYSLVLIVLVIAWQRRSPIILLVTIAAVILGAALAAFYFVPAIYEQKWVNIAEAVSAGARPLDNFLFVHTTDTDHDAFNRVISWIAVTETAVTFLAAWAARKWRKNDRTLWYALVIWTAACGLMMFSFSNPLWNILPKLRFMQFPWRLMLCVDVPFTLFVAFGIKRWVTRVAIYVALLGVLAFVWRHYQPPWWDTAADLREMQDMMADGTGYEGTDEYAPTGADPSEIDKGARRVTVEGEAHAAIRVTQWDSKARSFTAEMSAPDNLVLRLFNYPAWRVEVNDQLVQAGTREGTGQMLVPVLAGVNRVEITFARTWDRTLGGWISLLALVLIFVSTLYEIDLTWIPRNAK